MRKWIIFLILLIIAFIGFNYVYQDHRDIENEQSEYTVNALDFFNEFSNNPRDSEFKYLNKTIEVSGTVSELNKSNLTLNSQVFCQFTRGINSILQINSPIKIKGRFIGYDDLLEQIKLDQCNIIN